MIYVVVRNISIKNFKICSYVLQFIYNTNSDLDKQNNLQLQDIFAQQNKRELEDTHMSEF